MSAAQDDFSKAVDEERGPEARFSNCNRLHKLLVCGNEEEVLSEIGNICYQIERIKMQVMEEERNDDIETSELKHDENDEVPFKTEYILK